VPLVKPFKKGGETKKEEGKIYRIITPVLKIENKIRGKGSGFASRQ